MEADDVEKLFEIDDHVGAASAGHVTDARTLVDILRVEAQRNRAVYDEPIGVETIVEKLCDEMQDHTQSGGVRPFGCSLIVAGVDDGEPRVFETDPSGSFYEWRATAIGAKSDDVRGSLEEGYEDGLDTGEGIALAVDAIREHVEDDDEVGVEDLAAAVVEGDEPTFRRLAPDELDEYIERGGPKGEP
jgi:proteasome alpha subunit